MKRKKMLVAAVLLLAVLLFFWKKWGRIPGENTAEPTKTPTPTVTVPEQWKNVWILSSEEASVTFFYEGKEQTLNTRGSLPEPVSDCMADLTVEGTTITEMLLKPDKITAKVLQADEDGLELEGYGKLLFAKDWRLYRMYDGMGEEPSERLLVGTERGEFVLENGKICGALLTEEPKLETIRVLIGTENYRGLFHETVELTADCEYTVTDGTREEVYSAGEACSLTPKMFSGESTRLRIVPKEPDGKVQLLHIKRSGIHPAYRGSMEVALGEEGLLLINELSVEEYLYAVLPSEMPSDFSAEALKAQAICARSYAYTQLLANRYAKYGAHVDDSVACQVYNNIAETEQSVLAVKDTHGQVLLHKGEVASCYYFSTSCGYTTAAADVWENAEAVSYLEGGFHEAGKEAEPATKLSEEELKAFLLKEEVTTYDSESPWYRWQIFMSMEDLEKSINKGLAARYKTVPEQILTYDEKTDSYVSEPISDLGTLKSIRMIERGKGGIATDLLITGSKGVFLVKNEYNIRTVLAPLTATIYRENASPAQGASLLPSAFIFLQKGSYLEETGYLITGGGYGHGVGMSQCGADAMAKAGATCEEIINQYYPGTELGFIYK